MQNQGRYRALSRRCPASRAFSFSMNRVPASPSQLLVFAALFLLPRTTLGPLSFGSPYQMASAAPCDSTVQMSVAVTPFTSLDLSSVFDCEDGEFEVSWSGAVSITESIRIGRGTAVSIMGDGSGSNDETSDAETADTESAAVEAVNAFGPIFVVNGSELYLEGIVVRDGNATDAAGEGLVTGGGVHALDANVTVVGCVFEDNFALHSGGGIYAQWSRLVVRDTEFRRCNAGLVPEAGDQDAEAEGGGVKVEFTDIFIDRCSFEDCYATWRGGAVHHGFGNMSVINSTFLNNSAGSDNVKDESEVGEGGALSLSVCYRGFEGVGPCGVNDSTFFGNTVAREGGSVQLGDGSGHSHVEFTRCSMRSNSAGKYVNNDPQGDGGAISVGSDVTLVLVDSSVQDNYAGSKAGAIRISGGNGSWGEPGGTLVLRNCTFDANLADQGQGGVFYLAEYSMVTVEGDDNVFTNNYSGDNGGVIATTSDTRIMVQGGNFSGNFGDEYAGVLYAKGNVTITGGLFSNNEGDLRGGVFDAAIGSSIVITGGVFEGNIGGDHGGVGFVASGSTLLIEGGNFSGNVAEVGGGAFYVEEETDFSVTGGNFIGNAADFGGFVYKKGIGLTTCTGASIVNHYGVDGGAIYVVDGAQVEWECDVGMSHALTGSAIYARDDSNVTLRGSTLHDNALARGSVVFVVASYLQTIEVLFNDSTASPERSAVQIDSDSTYVAEYTSFAGFVGDAVIFSEGDVFLDSCDFSGSSAAILLYAEGSSATSTVRNAVLGDNNYEPLRRAASDAVEIPAADSLVNVNLTCSGAGEGEATSPPCSEGSLCLEGDVGVYCQCYMSKSTGNETCVSDGTDALTLVVLSSPETTYFPNLLEGELLLSQMGPQTDNSSMDADGSSGWKDGVLWNASGLSTEADLLMTWTIFPSTGVLLPGESVILGVVSAPSAEYDGATTVTFRVDWTDASTGSSRRRLASAAVASMDVIFYHCDAGNFWNISSHIQDVSEGCKSCTDDADGDVEGLDCEAAGVSTRTLPLSEGYWRASLTAITIRECLNQDACVGGSAVSSVDDYCAGGYEGPYCAVCSSGYGRGTANTCHACTESFTSGMYFVLVVVALLSLMILAILVAYLIGGQGNVTNMLRKTKMTLQRCCRCRGHLESTREPRRISGVAGEGSVASARANILIEAYEKGKHDRKTDATVHWEEAKGNIDCDEDATVEEDTAPVVGETQDAATREERRGKDRGLGGIGSRTRQRKMHNKNKWRQDIPRCPITGLRSRIPLSKLKIVIVVWQIMSAFAEITQVPLPPIYERFLSVVGIFSFDLTWALSASCIFTDVGFYEKLLITTIFPLLLLCVLGATFYISSSLPRPVADQTHRGPDASKCNTLGESISGRPGTDASGMGESVQASATSLAVPTRTFDRTKSGRSFHVRKPGPEGHSDLAQSHKWWLFARHTTMTIIILYLVYTDVSTVVFQTFACQELPEIGKSYLRADFSIECDTPKHHKYQIYAAFMILLYPLGIPAAFFVFLVRQRFHINPTVEKPENVGREFVVREKLEKRVKDQTVAPTSFLWGAYFPDRYYYEVCECIRRLLLTGLLVFVLPDTAGQVAISCMFSFISLLAFELLRPHVDYLDIQLYRTGCLVVFCSNFLALTIKAGIADADSNSSAVFAVALVAANVLLFLAIWWNTWVSVAAIFSPDHVQGEAVGFDVLGEDQMNKILGTTANDNDDDGERSHKNEELIEGSVVEEKEAPRSAGAMEPSPMPKILGHVWHPKTGHWAAKEVDDVEGALKISQPTG